MSGYVLVRPFFLAKDLGILTSAAFKRYWRLMPPAAISVFAAYLLLRFHAFTAMSAEHITGSIWLENKWTFLPHLHDALYQAFVGAFFNMDVPSYNPLLWTMTIEFLGSMLIFAVAAIVGAKAKRWLVYAGLVVLFSRTYFLGFIVGLILADYLSHPGTIARIRIKEPYLILLVGMGLLLGSYPSDLRPDLSPWYRHLIFFNFNSLELMIFWHTLGAAMVVGGLLVWTRAKQALSHPWLVKLGKMSFSLYLTHMIILCSAGTAMFTAFYNHHFGYRDSFLLTCLLTGILILGVSYLYTRWVDGPSIRYSRVVGKWLSSDGPMFKRGLAYEVGAAGAKLKPRYWKPMIAEWGSARLHLPWSNRSDKG